MDRPHQNRPDGFGDRPATVEAPVTIDQPYGARTLGATTDQLPAAAADPRAISASIAGPGVAPLQLRHADGGDHDDPAEADTGEINDGWEIIADSAIADPGRAPIQRSADGGAEGGDVHATAARGVADGGAALPHLSTIQQSFGRHDVSGVQAHVGGAAADAAGALGAEAYATGNHVAFRDGPSLHTAAHEAAHVVQQRAGVHLKGGVGEAGDAYEQQADAIADRVVAGQPAEDLLDDAASEGDEAADAAEGDEAVDAAPATAARPATPKPASPAAQKKTDSGRTVVQRAAAPAAVIAAGGAGLHKSNRKKKNPNQAVKVRTGGIFGTGIKQTIPFGTRLTIDRAKPVVGADHVHAEHGGEIGYVKKAHVRSEAIGNSGYFIIGAGTEGQSLIVDHGNNDAPVDTASFATAHADLLKNSLVHVFNSAVPVEDIPGLIKNMIKQSNLGVPPDPGLFQLAVNNIDEKVRARVQTDKAALVQANLITQQHDLVAVRFTGADFHKGGQAPFFLEFETADPQNLDRRRVVYKPGNLGVDRQLFGSQQGSFAKQLEQGGTQISNYTILAKEDAQHEKYGFMEFVRSDTPHDANDLLGVYRSLGANMALSYLAGLEDIHQENVLLLRDRVQVIDMEATTGQFTRRQNEQGNLNPHAGGFLGALWNKALHEGIKQKLTGAVAANTLVSAPQAGAAQAALVNAFRAVLDTAKDQNFDNDWNGQTQALGGQQSRLVPIATENFYKLIAPAKGMNDLNAWQHAVDHDTDGIATSAGLNSGHTLAFIKNVLRSPGTYHALCRGEVPFYKRDLANTNVFDEEGNQIASAGCSKVGQAIGQEMGGRRQELQQQNDQAAVYAQFNAQMVPQVNAVNQTVLDWIAGQERRNQRGN